MSPAILTNANQIIASVSDSVETNMTQQDMAKFINMQLSDGASWTIESVAATGTGDTQACYSSGSQPLYVMWRMMQLFLLLKKDESGIKRTIKYT